MRMVYLCRCDQLLINFMRSADVTQSEMFSYRSLEQRIPAVMTKRSLKRSSTLGADKNYDTAGFVKAMREQSITPHVAQKTNGVIDGRTTRHAGYGVNLRVRKRIEEIFGRTKTVGGLRKTRFIGLAPGEGANDFYPGRLQPIAFHTTHLAS